ncbi:glycoside hydrolase family 2 TIM barrel-domain containing protein [Lacticaseibacillus kribbianus]|uniref:glycoside hydrolase family 2 TIM barrel-domain containing protein n=1 Tax=Lacticaseibacillus kribbianus TaxID=2926292 RepID=UPI001CD58B89|nr:glycoside hydrolase family 2 TIM barrel-domain containing protein [Lacticaseibacillus kribbianus]
MTKRDLLEDPQALRENTEPARSYYIPYPTEATALKAKRRTESPCFTLLDGDWDFRYLPDLSALDEQFWADGDLTTDAVLPVPATWQNHGYDHHQYTNVSYPIPFQPPFVPDANPAGYYRRSFTVADGDDSWYLNFEGKDSAMYVWVNGRYVGYDSVPHANSEFDVTAFVHPGENDLAVLVAKWSVGTYFEDQDKFRTSGLIRSVYLLARPQAHATTLDWHTTVDVARGTGTLTVDAYAGPAARYALVDAAGQQLAAGDWTVGTAITVADCAFWNAEHPYLYRLVVTAGDEALPFDVGFRQWTLEAGVLRLNGQAVKLYGTNYHDSDPRVGAAVTLEMQRRDLVLMKKHHFNAIRTSHYPKAPEFYALCDRMGFYVVSEADVECHGAGDLYGAASDMDQLVEDPTYAKLVLDRIQRMVTADRLFACLFCWSMGNESGFGADLAAACRWTHAADPTRLVHYEGLSAKEAADPESTMDLVDVYSRMYESPAGCQAFCDRYPKLPLMLCEYAHAMGNGPGGLAVYDELMQRFDNFIGAFVWEWCDHAMVIPGTHHLGYGGDFGEFPDAGNFCMDGLVYPDRRPHTGLLEYQATHLPIALEAVQDGQLVLHNRLDFTAGGAYTGFWRVSVAGQPGPWQALALTGLAPHKTATFAVSLPRTDALLSVEWTLGEAGTKAPLDGVGIQQQLLQAPTCALPALADKGEALTVTQTPRTVTVTGAGFTYVLDAFAGTWRQLTQGGHDWLRAPMAWQLWRAPIDNDRDLAADWRAAGYDRVVPHRGTCTVSEKAGAVAITIALTLTAPKVQQLAALTVTWTVATSGQLRASVQVTRTPGMPAWPRFGLQLSLDRAAKAEYLGMGPMESYRDKHEAASLNWFTTTAQASYEPYVKPQEHGSHYATRELAVTTGGHRLHVAFGAPASFSLIPYTAAQLTAAAHDWALPASDAAILSLDYAQNGIGSASCGPRLPEWEQFTDASFSWQLALDLTTEAAR